MWLALALGGCSSTPNEDGTPPSSGGSERTLAVEGGYGGGSYAAGDTVHVWAGVDPQRALAAWTGDIDVLLAPLEWNSGFTMPDRDVSLVAGTSPVDAHLETRTYALPLGERTVLGSFAPSPVGVVLFFHGAGYSIDELRANAASTLTMALARGGYSVVAVQSEAEVAAGTGGWNASLTDNPDLDEVRALVDLLRGDGTAPAGVPVFAMGMSSGGMFAHTVGAELPAAGVVAFCAPGSAAALAATTAPTAWFMAANDQTFKTGVADATGFRDGLAGRGVAASLYVHPTTALYDERFERVTGVDADRSREIATSLRASGAVGASGKWLVAGSQVTSAMDLDGLDGLDSDQLAAVAAEIEIMAADHELYDDTAAGVVAFLDGVR